MTNLPPPGWYPDPQQSGGQRWWTGDGWSEHVQAAVAAVPASTAYVPMPFEPTSNLYGDVEAPVRPKAVGTRSSRAKLSNYPSYLGLVIGAVGLLYNPFALVSVPSGILSLLGLAIAINLKIKTGTFTGGFFALGGIALTAIGVWQNLEIIVLFLNLRNGIPGLPTF